MVDLHSKILDARVLTRGPNSLNFMQFLGKFLPPPPHRGLAPLATGLWSAVKNVKGCSHDAIATTNCLSQLMGCVTFSVIVTILPAGGFLGSVYDVACIIYNEFFSVRQFWNSANIV